MDTEVNWVSSYSSYTEKISQNLFFVGFDTELSQLQDSLILPVWDQVKGGEAESWD